jgi:hypothetical protein
MRFLKSTYLVLSIAWASVEVPSRHMPRADKADALSDYRSQRDMLRPPALAIPLTEPDRQVTGRLDDRI